MEEFITMLRSVDRYYLGFEQAVVSYIKMPGNSGKQKMIEDFISSHPNANSSDVLEYMITETGFYDVYPGCIHPRNSKSLMV